MDGLEVAEVNLDGLGVSPVDENTLGAADGDDVFSMGDAEVVVGLTDDGPSVECENMLLLVVVFSASSSRVALMIHWSVSFRLFGPVEELPLHSG